MRRILLIITFVYFEEAFAREFAEVSNKHFDFAVGMNVSNVNFNKEYPTPATHVKAAWKSGIIIGFLMRVPMTRNFLSSTWVLLYPKRQSR